MEKLNIKLPEVGFTDLLRCVTQAGRQALVRKFICPFTKIETMAALAAEGVSEALDAGTGRLSDERCSQIVTGCGALEICCSLVKKSVAPSGDEGKSISPAERTEIAMAINEGVSSLLTQDAVDAKIEELIKKVP